MFKKYTCMYGFKMFISVIDVRYITTYKLY